MASTNSNTKDWIIIGFIIGGLGIFAVLTIAAVVFLLLSKSPTEKTIEIKSTYSIICPDGWNFSDKSTYDFDDLTCEADGWDSSGIFMLYAFSDTLTPVEDMHQTYTEAFEENMLLSGFVLDSGVFGEYGSFSGIRSTYTGSLLGIQHDGMVFTFRGCDKTFVVVTQTAEEDAYKYLNAFESLEMGVICL